ncbi:MAG TPA: hypothetical protein VHQ86_03500 [Candidatus Saccharimonadia bacterium]|jgi:hypothetical protein|nr:hypothetical protein [Candidatus Saccharimonadia bacterium]
MNMDLKLNLDLKNLDLKKLLPVLKMLQPYLVGVALIAVFAYTSYVVNNALETKADPNATAAQPAAPRIIFDQSAITTIKNLEVTQGQVPTGDLGTSNPFN